MLLILFIVKSLGCIVFFTLNYWVTVTLRVVVKIVIYSMTVKFIHGE